jgi:ATP-dependent RNA helicase DeaD
MLVATDVAARGIDVNDVTHVINYNLPEETENYTHRSGRTARAGKKGISIAIVTSKDLYKVKDIERMIGKKFEKGDVPNGVQVCEKQLFHLVNKLHHVTVNEKEIESYLPAIYEELKDLNKEEIIKRFVSEEFNRFLDYYSNTPDLNEGSGGQGGNSKTTRFFLNLGEMDGLNRGSLKDFLIECSGINGRMIFNIDVKNSFSFFETETQFNDLFLAINDKGTMFNDRKLSFEISSGKGGGGNREGGFKREFKGGGGGGYKGGERKYGNKPSYKDGNNYNSERSYGGGEKSYGGGGKSYGGGGKSYSGGEKTYGEKSFGGGGDTGNRKEGGERRKRFSRNK